MSKKWYNFVKIHDIVTPSCPEVEMIVTSKCMKFQSNTSKGIGNKWSGTKNLNQSSMSKMGHNFVKIQEGLMSSCLVVGLMVANKYVKFQSNN